MDLGENVENVSVLGILTPVPLVTATEQLESVSDVLMTQLAGTVKSASLDSLEMLLLPEILEILKAVSHVSVIHLELSTLMITSCQSVTVSLENVPANPMSLVMIVKSAKMVSGI